MEPNPITLASVVRRAAEIVDPDDTDPIVGDFQERFEDADEPITTVDDLDRRLGDILQELDPAVANGGLSMLAAVTSYLAYRRDELNADDGTILRLAARAEWSAEPPEVVQEWLGDRGIHLR
jgi:hypothetical protein